MHEKGPRFEKSSQALLSFLLGQFYNQVWYVCLFPKRIAAGQRNQLVKILRRKDNQL